jgi:acyl transferase domain-containing protein
MALVGGVCLTLDPEFYVASSKLGIFSPTGHCRAFDGLADGFVHGEGVGFVVLKPLKAALRDHCSIYGIIRGTAVNHDGRSNGLTAPNGLAQTRLQQGLYHKLAIDPASIGYVEAHGTGTPLGDLVEVQALSRSFEGLAAQSVAIGSLKPNIGHPTTAAGILGVIKAALCAHHGKLVPSINCTTPNPQIHFESTPFYVNTQTKEWLVPEGGVRRAAINSFGIGGTNGHCVVEGVPPPLFTPEQERWLMVLISARTQGSLEKQLLQLREWLEVNPDIPLEPVAFTLVCGRSRFDYGYLFSFCRRQQFMDQLEAVMDHRLVEGVVPLADTERRQTFNKAQGTAGEDLWRVALRMGANQAPMEALTHLIAGGFQPRWEEWFTKEERRRLHLPVYPFHTQRCWLLQSCVDSSGDEKSRSLEGVPSLSSSHLDPESAPLPGDVLSPSIYAQVLAILAKELGLPLAALDPDVPLTHYGMESVKAINLRFQMEAHLGVDLPIQDIVEANTARDLAERVSAAQGSSEGGVSSPLPFPETLEHVTAAELTKGFLPLSLHPEPIVSHANQ